MSEYFTSADEKIFVDLRRGKRCTNEIKKLNKDNSNLLVTITLKNGALCNWILSRQMFIFAIKQRARYEL